MSRLGKYVSVLVEVFRAKYDDQDLLEFDQADLREAAEKLGIEIRNVPDLTYNLRSRAPLPEVITAAGYTTIEILGRGQYALTRADNDVVPPEKVGRTTIDASGMPEAVWRCVGSDEQGVLSTVCHLDLLSQFMGFPCHHVQDHLRTTGSMGQQVEADAVFASTSEGMLLVMPAEAKGLREKLGLSQMKSTIDAVLSKVPHDHIRPIGVQLVKPHIIRFYEFSYSNDGGNVVVTGVTKAHDYVLRNPPERW